MAQVQTNTEAGEMTQRFIEFVMMHAQNAALFLGQIPNPQTGEAEVNLPLAKMFIDQLSMIRNKTMGNLNHDETAVINEAVSNLQMAFVEVSRQAGGEPKPAASPREAIAPGPEPDLSAPDASENVTPSAELPVPAVETAPAEAESGSRKKFTKSYGA